MLSVLDQQDQIVEVDVEPIHLEPSSRKAPVVGQTNRSSAVDPEHVYLLQEFTSLLQVKGRSFGQPNRQGFGMSDGNRGVQWNLEITPATGTATLGVNLEGTKATGDWLVSGFLFASPDIGALKRLVVGQSDVFVGILRDAWQGLGRVDIVEQYVGGQEFALGDLDVGRWNAMLEEALGCLNEDNGYRGRKQDQTVTLRSDERKVCKDISPHLVIRTPVNTGGNPHENLSAQIDRMRPVHQWVVKAYKIGQGLVAPIRRAEQQEADSHR